MTGAYRDRAGADVRPRYATFSGRAPRHLSRGWRGFARGGWLLLCVWLMSPGAGQAQDPDANRGSGTPAAPGCVTTDLPPFAEVVPGSGPVTQAYYFGPTRDYGHGVLGDAIEARSVLVAYDGPLGRFCDQIHAGPERVFEDTNPRLFDLTGNGTDEVIVVAAHQRFGARIEVYGYPGPGAHIRLLAHTPYVGSRNRWRGVAAIGDLDGDGAFDIVEIDRPHLAKTMRVWRFDGAGLTEIANLRGLSNHRIGEPFITGGLRDCGLGPEVITADANWRQVMATRLAGGELTTRALGPFSPEGVAAALQCKEVG